MTFPKLFATATKRLHKGDAFPTDKIGSAFSTGTRHALIISSVFHR
jgi:hypothetical protein